MNLSAEIVLIKRKQPQTPKGALKPITNQLINQITNHEYKTLYFRQGSTNAYRTEYSGSYLFADYQT